MTEIYNISKSQATEAEEKEITQRICGACLLPPPESSELRELPALVKSQLLQVPPHGHHCPQGAVQETVLLTTGRFSAEPQNQAVALIA